MVVEQPGRRGARSCRRISNGEGLLSNNGASICNLMTGDATRVVPDDGRDQGRGRQGIGDSKAFLGFFFSPTGYLRSFTLFLGEFIKELIQARRTRRSGIQPQMHRGLKYAGMRAASNVLLRDVNSSLIIEEMYRGTNVIYADFTDYDELAHHCGPERVESFAGARRRRRGDRDARQGRPRTRRGRTSSSSCPTTARASARRSSSATARASASRPRPDGRPRDGRPDEDARPRARRSSTRSCRRSPAAKGVGPTVARAALAGPDDGRRRRPRRRRRCRRPPTSRRSPSSGRATSGSSGSPATTTG